MIGALQRRSNKTQARIDSLSASSGWRLAACLLYRPRQGGGHLCRRQQWRTWHPRAVVGAHPAAGTMEANRELRLPWFGPVATS